MSSPFTTFEEFSNAEGAIYTFANNPTMIAILLILSLLITLYFFYSSFFMKQEDLEHPLDTKAIGLLLVAGFASVMGSLLHPEPAPKTEATRPAASRSAQASSPWKPLALLGLTSIGGIGASRKAMRRSSRKVRSGQRSRSR